MLPTLNKLIIIIYSIKYAVKTKELLILKRGQIGPKLRIF